MAFLLGPTQRWLLHSHLSPRSGSLVRPCWMSFRTFFRTTGVTPLFEPQEHHHLGVKNPLVTVSQFPVEHVQVVLPQTRLCLTHKLFGLLNCDAGPTSVSPTAPSFELDSGGHESVLYHPGRKETPTCLQTFFCAPAPSVQGWSFSHPKYRRDV